MVLIGAAVVILLALVVPALTGGGNAPAPAPTLTTGAFGTPGTTAAAPTTAGRPPTAAEQLGQAVQAELGEAGQLASVTVPPGGDQVTVTWDIRRAGSQGLTENNARFGVMRIMRAVQESQLTAGGDPPRVRLVGRYQPAGATTPVTVVRLRFDPSTVERADFDDRNYLEAFELADAASVQPSFRG
jgi:hypothetical protein